MLTPVRFAGGAVTVTGALTLMALRTTVTDPVPGEFAVMSPEAPTLNAGDVLLIQRTVLVQRLVEESE